MIPRSFSQLDVLSRFAVGAPPEEIWAQATRTFADLGSPTMTLGTAPVGRPHAPTIRSTASDRLLDDYVAAGLHAVDPWMEICAATCDVGIMDFTQGTPARDGDAGTAQVRDLFRDHGYAQTMLVPCAGSVQTAGVVLYAETRDAAASLRRPETLRLLQLAATAFALSYRPGPGAEDDVEMRVIRPAAPLTAREIEVLQWLAAGLKTGQIAHRMALQDVTVTKHLANARRKLGARTREQALVMAVMAGLLSL
ncbi:DNA-binding response regulator, NarL/FixJ family, contains REC and HTH domains [Loktanella atrilutea]|uniref:DNA-binding response regulator, NarL/FixJ family, contains REC and HTH domains n=1 Tax=Loktanella atrilutea TaxID=366533 RepID=A0A1M4TX82_LOKAT|nr:LuxR C-terminal-related transcriptional regulator [Loktanella atrilutea]SHE49079.1 DNA-binding response regulator, NarL/FixJ family, contains REC and HTH domains [Loktanella atrilutea]